ncbi:MAG: hypothetical protein E6R03_05605 [Hyphomicrobiaceae bacterium]|nr:MAG: hypothetical protein E6R03_05605 [Hyphomicrobiaceae bacterium]
MATYKITINTETTTATKKATAYAAFNGVVISNIALTTFSVEIDSEDAEWFESELESDDDVLSY